MQAAYRSLTADQQVALLNRDPAGEKALQAAYLRQINPHPNRAARRRAARQKGH